MAYHVSRAYIRCANTYWENKGKYSKEYDKMLQKLVPSSGKADTNHGELLRTVNNWYYRVFNDGELLGFRSSEANKQIRTWKELKGMTINLDTSHEDIEKLMDKVMEIVIREDQK